MFTFTQRESILIAVTLAIILGVPLLVPALYGSSTITLPDHAGDRPARPSERNEVGGDHGDARSREPNSDCGLAIRFPV
jgi:hypothetical protein